MIWVHKEKLIMKHHNATGSNRTMFWLIGGFTVLAVILIGFVAVGEQKKAEGAGQIVQYQANDTDKPTAAPDSIFQDVGKMSVKDEKTIDFILTNSGTKPLQLFNISTSCGCTAGVITINDAKSPETSMHDKNNWNGTIEPGKTATVSLIYRPSIMPVKGDVSRSVYVETNDPAQKQLTFSIKAFVE